MNSYNHQAILLTLGLTVSVMSLQGCSVKNLPNDKSSSPIYFSHSNITPRPQKSHVGLFETTVHFSNDSSTLSESDLVQIQLFTQQFNLDDAPDINVIGHTDNTESDNYNLALGLRRAEATMLALLELNYPKQKITTYSKGELKPISDNESLDGKALNRRVEIRFAK